MFFSRTPLVGIALCCMLGIVLAGSSYLIWLKTPPAVFAAAFMAILTAAVVCYHSKNEAGSGVCTAAFFVLTGFVLKIDAEHRHDADEHALAEMECQMYVAEVRSLGEDRGNALRYDMQILQVGNGCVWKKVRFHALISIDSALTQPQTGCRIFVQGRLRQPNPPLNPEQFDYQSYLRKKSILWTGKVKKGFVVIGGRNPGFSLQNAAADVSIWADEVFAGNIDHAGAYGLIKAMVLGRRDALDEEQVQDYVSSGAVHILSVSGMHVAIIFYMLTLALGWLRRWQWGKFVYAVSLLLLIGFYSLATGLSPSVQRSALMCAVFVIAELAGRKQYAMNSLALAALLILISDPDALYDVGFQLSFLAMSGIFLLYEPIYAMYKPYHFADRFVWQVTALALAAQAATFPLCTYYFHQFPVYFWLVNPLIIAFTNVLLPAAMGLLLVSCLPFEILKIPFAWIAECAARLTNWAAELPGKLPGFLMENLSLSINEVVLAYVVLIVLWQTWRTRNIFYIKLTALSVILWLIVSISTGIQIFLTPENVTFAVTGYQVRCWKRGDKLYVACDRSFMNDRRARDFSMKNYLASREINEVVFLKTY